MIGTVNWEDIPQAIRTVMGIGSVIIAVTVGWVSKADKSEVARLQVEQSVVLSELRALRSELRSIRVLVCDLNERDSSCRQ
jgi:hypothetical protein